jgi:potassium-transporting ATPase KdpC subunit
MLLRQIKPAVILLGIFILMTGIIYPLVVTGIAQVIFPRQANGSLIVQNNQVLGSQLIGQQFDDPKYFWGRPSATGSYPYNASASGGTNYSVMNQDLQKQVQDRIAALQAADPTNQQPVPVDLVTASGSGLDPDISVAAARYQAGRVARARGLPVEQVMALIDQYTQGRQLGFLGEPRVNVLTLNLALDALK